MRHSKLFLAAALAGTSLVGCAIDSADVGEIGQKEQDTFILTSSLWPSPTIPVCWENGTSGNATQRGWVRQAVERTWEHHANIDFTGWGACSSGAPGIHIKISEGGPHVKALGRYLNGYTNGMELNFTFNSWSTSCKGREQYCIETIAVHEFGHAIGIAHEQNRADTPNWCNAEQGSDGDWVTGPWDLNSVMNYCNPQWSGNGNLSIEDIRGVQRAYGSKPGSIKLRHKQSGQCLYNENPRDGGKVRHWSCWDDPNMSYELESVSGHGPNAVRLKHRASNSCIYGSQNNGGQVHHWACWDDPNMVYIVEDLGGGEYRLRHKKTGNCLYAGEGNGGGTYNWTCWNDPNMVFTFENANPRVPAVCFYEHADYEGQSYCYSHGDVPYVGDGHNDKFSSVSILDEQAIATVYEHSNYSGMSTVLDTNLESFGSWNERISSLRVERECAEKLECERGSKSGSSCYLGQAPAGRKVYGSGGDLYYEAGVKCSVGSYDSANCYMGSMPAGSTSFKWSNNLYYTPRNGNECPVPGTWFDSRNCYVGSLDHGYFEWNGGIYKEPEADPNSCTVPGSVFDNGACLAARYDEQPWSSGSNLFIAATEEPASWPIPATVPTHPVDGDFASVTSSAGAFFMPLDFYIADADCSDVVSYEVEVRFGTTLIGTHTVMASGDNSERATQQIGSGNLGQEHSWRVRPKTSAGTYGAWSDWEAFRPDIVVGL